MSLSPPIVQFVAHGVLVCNCPAKSILLLAVIGGNVTCPECKRSFRVKELSYVVNGNTAELNCATEEVGQVVIPDLAARRRPYPGSIQ